VRAEFVEWVDSCANSDAWISREDVEFTVKRCHSVGFVVDDSEDALTLAGSYGTEADGTTTDQLGMVITIPKVAIVARFRVPVV
jgi:hypothetical protein